MRIALVILLAGTTLAACGQRGPLYLPDEDREDVPPVAAPAPSTPAAPAAPVASPIPRASPLPGQAAGTTADEDEAARRNRIN